MNFLPTNISKCLLLNFLLTISPFDCDVPMSYHLKEDVLPVTLKTR